MRSRGNVRNKDRVSLYCSRPLRYLNLYLFTTRRRTTKPPEGALNGCSVEIVENANPAHSLLANAVSRYVLNRGFHPTGSHRNTKGDTTCRRTEQISPALHK